MRSAARGLVLICAGSIAVAAYNAGRPGEGRRGATLARLNGSTALTTGAAATRETSYGAQREPGVPKELRERFGAWAEYYLRHAPEYTAVEILAESVRSRKAGLGSERVTSCNYSLRRGEARSEWIESCKPIESANAKTAGTAPSKALLPESVLNPLALVSRLAERNHERMKYFFALDTSEVHADEVLVGYRQIDGTGLVEVEGKAIPASGLAWVHPDDGHTVRMEEQFEHKNTRYTFAVEFQLDDALKAWVPREITVRVFEKGHLQAQRIYTYTQFAPLGAAGAGTTPPPLSKPE